MPNHDALAQALGETAPPPAVLFDAELLDALDTETAAALVAVDDADPWTVTGTETAEWAMWKLRTARARIAEAEDQARRWTARIQAWLDTETAGDRRTAEFFEAHLCRYAIAVRDESGGRKKSVAVPSGKVSTRSAPPKVEILDADAIVAWALANELDDVLSPRVLVSDLRKAVQVLDRAVFVAGDVVPEALIVEVTDPETGDVTEVAVDDAGELLAGATIVDGPIVVHRLGIVVPGVEVTDEVVTASVTPAP